MALSKAAQPDKKQLRVFEQPGKSSDKVVAELAINPVINAAATVVLFAKGTLGNVEITETVEAINDAVAKVRGGNMSGPEATLVSQAATLDSIFTELVRRSGLNMGDYINASERYMRLALKAQAQCRATIETLAAMKNPPVVIARQANISNGPQQVNNGQPRAEENTIVPNELLETEHGKRLDCGAPLAPVIGHPELVAVEDVERA